MASALVTIDSYLEGTALDTIVADVRAGLARPPRELPPKYFYDARGSELFEHITTLPEYYPARCERAILNRRAPELVDLTGARELVELGSGSASKTRALLYAMAGAGALERYVPFDVSPAVVERCADELIELYPGLEVHGIVGDFERHLRHVPPPPSEGGRVVALLGGTIGNLRADERARFLASVRALLGEGDRLLLGTDLVKDVRVLEAAYDDAEGVTAEFNRNVLHVLNRELDGDFEPEAFDHVARFDSEASWIEMRLRARGEQRVRLTRADLDLTLADGEEIRTETSAKFTRDGIARELADAGMRLEQLFTDDDGMFAVSLAAPAG